MSASTIPTVVFLPGSIMPASIQYGPILNILRNEIRPVLKDLEVYSGDVPDPEYQLSQEVEGLKQVADKGGYDRFHLVGYSGGGAVALAFVATYPEQVLSLSMTEPAVIPSPEWFKTEQDKMSALDRAMALPPAEQMREFIRLQILPGIEPPSPPPGEPPSWMGKRPAGIKAMMKAFSASNIQLDQFRRYDKPVYLAIGSLSDPIEQRKANFMAKLFPDFRLEIYKGSHHFDPPQRAEPERYAKAVAELWKQAEPG